MKSKREIFYNDIKSFVVTASPFLLTTIALIDEIPIGINLRLLFIYLPVGLSSLICVIRKEIPIFYPYSSIKGRKAQIISGIVFAFWSLLGLTAILTMFYEF